jgi:simple sugar transport system ATP-binding protein
VLVASRISKRFGRIVALADVDFRASDGEIRALVGENGAGKSTLINIFAGRLRPDGGEVLVDGVALSVGSAAAALGRGVAAVYQSPLLFERMQWEENLALGGFCPHRFSLGEVAGRTAALANELGFALPQPGAIVEQRSLAERVRLEILRALSFNPRVLILDEPTGMLAPGELAPFLQLLQRLRSQGRAVILVTHKLSEALTVADRITVLRHGRVVGERIAAETSEAELAELMMGNVLAPSLQKALGSGLGTPVVELEQVTLESAGRRALDRVSLTLSAGAITGIAGVDGNGQEQLVEVMAGVRAPTLGRVRVHNFDGRTGDAMAVIAQNRDLHGLILDLSLWENLLLSRPLRKRLSARYGRIRRSQAADFCREVIQRFRVRGGGPSSAAGSLSGGNRQRFVVARALAAAPRAIVAHDIGRGLDLSAAAELRSRLREYAGGGGAVLLISSDLDELLELSERLYVISRGRLSEVPAQNRNPVEIGLLMSGATR